MVITKSHAISPPEIKFWFLLLAIVGYSVQFSMTIKGGTSKACAVCKYQRRRCTPDCVLAPYFPADDPKLFRNAHKLFGVSKIVKILEDLNDEQKDDAMESIIFESNMREMFPVHGCLGIICQLDLQLRQALEELRMVQARLAICKEHYHTQILNSNSRNYFPNAEFQLGETSSRVEFQPQLPVPNLNPHEVDENLAKQFWLQNSNSGVKGPELGSSFLDAQPGSSQLHFRQSDIDLSVFESSVEDTTQKVEEHASTSELRRAAACFSLTSQANIDAQKDMQGKEILDSP